MIVLSIQCDSHNSSVALVKNHKILFAASEERYSRKKLDGRTPVNALRACLRQTRINPSDIDSVIFVSDSFPKSFFDYLKIYWMPVTQTNGKYLLWLRKPWSIFRALTYMLPSYLLRELYPIVRIKQELRGFGGKYEYVHHHLAHLYSAYYTSGWKKCLVACFEGGGLVESVSIYYTDGNKWEKLVDASLPVSPGAFYSLVTLILGFKPLRHEGKITGLSAYGNPTKAYTFVKSLMWVDDGHLKFDYYLSLKTNADYAFDKSLPSKIARYKREDIAAAFQKRLEECITELVQYALKKHKVEKIALSGGVVANVKLNQRIYEIPEIKQVFVHPGMGDEGLALGAALYKTKTHTKLDNVYFGSGYTKRDILSALKKYDVKYEKVKNIASRVAELIAEGKIVARFAGRMEYGPRALGNRSILASATDPTINDTLNKKLKRTEFMPFAPVLMKELSKKCFKNLKGSEYTASFMTITYDCTAYMKKKCPAVVHVDGTARPQLVSKGQNPSYYKILKEYYKLTKIPAIINTSFNMHEEPIVCSPDDALRSFTTGNLDYLAIEDYLVSRS